MPVECGLVASMGKKLWIMLAVGLFAVTSSAADETGIAVFLQRLGQENGFEIQGIDLVGRDTFRPPANTSNIEKVVARALNRYNYVVTYSNKQVRRVVVLGRKGSEIGAMPEEYSEPPPPD